MDFPLKGWPASIISVLKREVADFIEDPEIKWFYIGRTNNLAAANHAMDLMISSPCTKRIVLKTQWM